MPTTTADRPSRFRKCVLESLEFRQLMASDLVNPVVDDPPSLVSIASESQAVDKLSALAVKQYAYILGQPAPGYVHWRQNYLRVFDANGGALQPTDAFAVLNAQDVSNNQQLGVDEGDGVEVSSDGFLFAVRRGIVFVIDARDPSNLKEAGRSSVLTDGFQTASINLVGDRLVVVSKSTYQPPARNYPATIVTILDVSQRTTPKAVRSFEIEGESLEARVVNGKLILIQQEQGFPAPLLIASDPIHPLGNSQRYETEAEYLARIRPTIISTMSPDFKEIDANGQMVRTGDLGDWHDVAIIDLPSASTQVQQSIVTIDVAADIPGILDSEEIIADYGRVSYVTENNVYLTSFSSSFQTAIIRIGINSGNGDLVTNAVGRVQGWIQESRFMDEYQGDLRVVTNSQKDPMQGDFRNQVNLFVLHAENSTLEIIGQLVDIAPDETLYSAEFDGEKAWITTTLLSPDEMMSIDPLHGIDLSDPTKPKVLSALVIPGITQYMHWIDDTHLIGVGTVQQNRQWHAQVSLYEVTNLSAPKLLDTWASDDPAFASIHNSLSSLRIHYDAETKTLTLPLDPPRMWFTPWATLSDTVFSESGSLRLSPTIEGMLPEFSNFPFTAPKPVLPKVAVLKVDPSAQDPLRPMGSVAYEALPGQGFVVGSTLFVVSETSVSTYALSDLKKRLDWIALNESGTPIDPEDEEEVPAARLVLTATHDDGTTATDIKKGDEIWVTVQAQDLRRTPKGIYSAYVNIAFDQSKFEIVGDAETLGEFTNQVRGEVNSTGWHDLGAFSNSRTAKAEGGAKSIVRFKIRALANAALELSATPSETPGLEILAWGLDTPISNSEVQLATLTVPVQTAENTVPDVDVNHDGIESPLDSLIVINYLNRNDEADGQQRAFQTDAHSEAFDMDVNNDGQVSLLDVLVIINRLNTKGPGSGGGHGEGEQNTGQKLLSGQIDSAFATTDPWHLSPMWLDIDSIATTTRRAI